MPSLDTRKSERDSLFLTAELSVADGTQRTRVTVRNLSARGMMMEGGPRLTRGTRVTLEIRNIGLVEGAIAWVRGNATGVAFDEKVDPKLARTPVFTGDREAPAYARAALEAPRHDGWNGKLRRV